MLHEIKEKTEDQETQKAMVIATTRVKRNSGWLWTAIACFCLGLLIGLSGLLWLDLQEKFPLVHPGSYLGELNGAFDNLEHTGLYLERLPGENKIIIGIFNRFWHVSIVDTSKYQAQATAIQPLAIKLPNAVLRFTGNMVEQSYSGVVYNQKEERRGNWQLHRIEDLSSSLPIDQEIPHQWAKLKAELYEIDQQIIETKMVLAFKDGEVNRLKQSFNSSGTHTQRMVQAIAKLIRRFHTIQEELEIERQKAKKLIEEIKLVLSSSPAGKLVQLARESLKKDASWAEAMLLIDSYNEKDLEQSLIKAEHMSLLKQQIANEQRQIRLLKDKISEQKIRKGKIAKGNLQ